MAASTSKHAFPITLGPSLGGRQDDGQISASFVSVKYNFKPPSIAQDATGYLSCPTRNNAEWVLEYETPQSSQGGKAGVQGFVGTLTPARNVDCILVWDPSRKAYVLDRLASSMSMKFNRNYTKLSKGAERALASPSQPRRSSRSSTKRSHADAEGAKKPRASQAPVVAADDDEEFARQLEEGLAEIDDHDVQTEQPVEADEPVRAQDDREGSPKRAKLGLGLGLTGAGLLQQEGITPRASPLIDRPSKVSSASAYAQLNPSSQASISTPGQPRVTPQFSPASQANSPRLAPHNETSLSATWKPPPQRSAMAISFDDEDEDDDDDDDDDEDDEDEEEDDEEEGEEDDDDLEAFTRQLEGSLQDSSSAVNETAAPSKGPPRTRRASARGSK